MTSQNMSSVPVWRLHCRNSKAVTDDQFRKSKILLITSTRLCLKIGQNLWPVKIFKTFWWNPIWQPHQFGWHDNLWDLDLGTTQGMTRYNNYFFKANTNIYEPKHISDSSKWGPESITQVWFLIQQSTSVVWSHFLFGGFTDDFIWLWWMNPFTNQKAKK